MHVSKGNTELHISILFNHSLLLPRVLVHSLSLAPFLVASVFIKGPISVASAEEIITLI